MAIKQYMVDAFAENVFTGNQAAVCITEEPLAEDVMQSIAIENNFSETAFLVPASKAGGRYSLRWFTPGGEIDLCGHATLASAFVVGRFMEPGIERVVFDTKSEELVAKVDADVVSIDMPAYKSKRVEVTDDMERAFGVRPIEAWLARDLVCVLPDELSVRRARPDSAVLMKLDGLLQHATARADAKARFDCVSRSFAPKLGVYEDPVCGSGHCAIVPIWAKKLGKADIRALQASTRTGVLECCAKGDVVTLAGHAVLYAEAELNVQPASPVATSSVAPAEGRGAVR